MLEGDEDGRETVKEHGAFVVGRPQRLEKGRRDCQEWEMLDIGVAGR